MVYPIVTDIILAHRFLSPAGWTSNEYALRGNITVLYMHWRGVRNTACITVTGFA